MNPLQALILEQMAARGWSPKDVEARGITHATLHRYMNPLEFKSPPRRQTLQQLANALDLPIGKVEKAAVESVGYIYTSTVGDTVISSGSFEELSEDEKQARAAVLYEMIKDYLPDA